MDLLWDPGKTPLELHSLLKTLGEEYPVRESSGKSSISFSLLKSEENQLKVSRQEDSWLVEYTRPTRAARGLA